MIEDGEFDLSTASAMEIAQHEANLYNINKRIAYIKKRGSLKYDIVFDDKTIFKMGTLVGCYLEKLIFDNLARDPG